MILKRQLDEAVVELVLHFFHFKIVLFIRDLFREAIILKCILLGNFLLSDLIELLANCSCADTLVHDVLDLTRETCHFLRSLVHRFYLVSNWDKTRLKQVDKLDSVVIYNRCCCSIKLGCDALASLVKQLNGVQS